MVLTLKVAFNDIIVTISDGNVMYIYREDNDDMRSIIITLVVLLHNPLKCINTHNIDLEFMPIYGNADERVYSPSASSLSSSLFVIPIFSMSHCNRLHLTICFLFLFKYVLLCICVVCMSLLVSLFGLFVWVGLVWFVGWLILSHLCCKLKISSKTPHYVQNIDDQNLRLIHTNKVHCHREWQHKTTLRLWGCFSPWSLMFPSGCMFYLCVIYSLHSLDEVVSQCIIDIFAFLLCTCICSFVCLLF